VEVYTPRRNRRAYLLQQLHTIRYKIERLAKAGLRSNDIVVLYYHGDEAPPRDLFRTTTDHARGRQAGLTWEDVDELFAQTPGAHFLLSDVDPDKLAGQKDNYPELESLVALLRDVRPSRTKKDPRLIQELQPDSRR
jgi:hypothetical protein